MTEAQNKVLLALYQARALMKTGVLGAEVWGKNSRRPPQSFARVAGKVLNSLKAKGFVRFVTSGGDWGWELTVAGKHAAPKDFTTRENRGPSLNALCAQQGFALTGTTERTGSYAIRHPRETNAKEIADAIKQVATRLAERACRLAMTHQYISVAEVVEAASRGEGDPL